jgi:hypothetical protein
VGFGVITLFSESVLLTTLKQDNKYDYVGAWAGTGLGNCIASFRTSSLYVVTPKFELDSVYHESCDIVLTNTSLHANSIAISINKPRQFFYPFWGGMEPTPLLLRQLLTCCVSPRWWWVCSNRWNAWQGKPKYSEKTCLLSSLFKTSLIILSSCSMLNNIQN